MGTLLRGVAFISGSSSGIGRTTAITFAKYGVTKFALVDIDPVGAIETQRLLKQVSKELEILVVTMDMAEEQSILSGMQLIIDTFGRIDYAVNNAGFGGTLGVSTDISTEDFRRVLDVNMTGLWIAQREQIRQMMKQEPSEDGFSSNRGVIVNMSSMLGLVGTNYTTPAIGYSTSKHGILGFTKSDANWVGRHNIRINAVCPGYVETAAFRAGVSESDILKAEVEKIPLHRFAQPEEIAEAISFLASPMSSYINGIGLPVDGGYTAQ